MYRIKGRVVNVVLQSPFLGTWKNESNSGLGLLEIRTNNAAQPYPKKYEAIERHLPLPFRDRFSYAG
jgi:hypothetical protein